MIHKTAIIDSNAKISKNVKIGPYSVIGANDEIDDEERLAILNDLDSKLKEFYERENLAN